MKQCLSVPSLERRVDYCIRVGRPKITFGRYHDVVSNAHDVHFDLAELEEH